MNKKFNYILTLLLFFITGCSSIYTVKDFSSKEKFYSDFNNSAKGKKINITFLNDSSITLENGAIVKNDSLFAVGYIYNKIYRTIPLKNIKNIEYTSYDYKSAKILLKDGEVYDALQIKISKDSVDFVYMENASVKYGITSVSNLKKVVYKNRWLGTPVAAIIGTAIGYLIGSSGAIKIKGGNGPGEDRNLAPFYAGIYCAPYGLVLGAIAGWLMGWNYVYKFNP